MIYNEKFRKVKKQTEKVALSSRDIVNPYCCFLLNVHVFPISGSGLLCRTMACFHVISISMISGGDYVVFTTFCGDNPSVHYLYILLIIMTSQWVMTLQRMPHCGITLSNDVSMDMGAL